MFRSMHMYIVIALTAIQTACFPLLNRNERGDWKSLVVVADSIGKVSAEEAERLRRYEQGLVYVTK